MNRWSWPAEGQLSEPVFQGSEYFSLWGFPHLWLGRLPGVRKALSSSRHPHGVREAAPWEGYQEETVPTICWAGFVAETSDQHTSCQLHLFWQLRMQEGRELWAQRGREGTPGESHTMPLGLLGCLCQVWNMNSMLAGDFLVARIHYPTRATTNSHAIALHYFNCLLQE